MTGGNLGVLYWLIKADSKEFDETVKGTKNKAESANEDVGMSFIKLGAQIQTFTMIYQQVAAVVGELVDAYGVQEMAEKKLEAVIRATGGAAGFTADEMKSMAVEMQKNTTFGDELVLGAQSILATFKSIHGETFPRTIEAAADLSAVFGQSLQQSTIMLGKALEDPIAGMGALRRVGVTLSTQTQELVKDFIALGQVEKAQNEILKAVEGQVKGAAQTMADSGTGKIQQLNNALGDLKEMLGEIIVDTIIPTVEGLTEAKKAMEGVIWVVKKMFAPVGAVIKLVGKQIKLYADVYNWLTGVKKEQKEYNTALETGTSTMKDYTAAHIEHMKQYDKYRKPSKKDLEEEKKAREAIAKLNKKYADMYFELTHDEIEIIKKKMKEEIEAAKKTGASVTLIKKAYLEQIKQIEEERRNEAAIIEQEELEMQREKHQEFVDLRREGERMYSEYLAEQAEKRKEMADQFIEEEKVRQEELREEYQKTAEQVLDQMTDVIGAMVQAGMEGEDIWKAFGDAAKEAIASACKALGRKWLVQAAAAWVPGPTFNPAAGIGLAAAAAAAYAAAAIIPRLDTGGMVQKETLAVLHPNEVILPLDKGIEKLAEKLQYQGIGGNIYITINAGNINNEMDMRRVMQVAGRQLRESMRKM